MKLTEKQIKEFELTGKYPSEETMEKNIKRWLKAFGDKAQDYLDHILIFDGFCNSEAEIRKDDTYQNWDLRYFEQFMSDKKRALAALYALKSFTNLEGKPNYYDHWIYQEGVRIKRYEYIKKRLNEICSELCGCDFGKQKIKVTSVKEILTGIDKCRLCDLHQAVTFAEKEGHECCGQRCGLSLDGVFELNGNKLTITSSAHYQSDSNAYYESEGLDCDSEDKAISVTIEVSKCPLCHKEVCSMGNPVTPNKRNRS